jgi:hypothetical protein
MTTTDLRAEQSRLEAEIVKLQQALRGAERALAKRSRTPYPGPRGFFIGALVGGSLLFVVLVCLLAATQIYAMSRGG